ncbi:hypothetical protein CBR_g38102 [Chara braunii]|uniref:3-oxo-5-alpha-steroid 4-dehydrogenase C-terminal domain-containing protein n=1 Tax=Chara braunii TaxID=69332 RepID=A0A388K0A0_CHABU|nr:hypothetical protein CBR_g38102 [Chara braunii]|eukprot:GBG63484.1 hypothetical protein CBR_g38102 [Chara braunii]
MLWRRPRPSNCTLSLSKFSRRRTTFPRYFRFASSALFDVVTRIWPWLEPKLSGGGGEAWGGRGREDEEKLGVEGGRRTRRSWGWKGEGGGGEAGGGRGSWFCDSILQFPGWLLTQRWWLEVVVRWIWAAVALTVILPSLASSLPTSFNYSMTRMMSRGKLWKDGPTKLLRSSSGRVKCSSCHEDSWRRENRLNTPCAPASKTAISVILGALSEASVPQGYFSHFYVVATLWNGLLLLGVMKLIAVAHLPSAVTMVLSCFSSACPGMTPAVSHERRGWSGNASTCGGRDLIGGNLSTSGGSARLCSVSSVPPTEVEASTMAFPQETVILMILVQIHAIRRLYESLFVFKYRSSARMHIAGYLTGLCFYVGMPVSVLLHPAAMLATSERTKCLWTFIDELHRSPFWAAFARLLEKDVQVAALSVPWLPAVRCGILWLSLMQCAGLGVFFWGTVHQWRCHRIVGALRADKRTSSKTNGGARLPGKDEVISGDRIYGIPRGDWFEYVSCAHFLAEIVIYTGLILASGATDLTLCLLFAFVIGNLVLAAKPTHKWYLCSMAFGRGFESQGFLRVRTRDFTKVMMTAFLNGMGLGWRIS